MRPAQETRAKLPHEAVYWGGVLAWALPFWEQGFLADWIPLPSAGHAGKEISDGMNTALLSHGSTLATQTTTLFSIAPRNVCHSSR